MSDVRSTADSDCCSMKFVTGRPFADPEVAARKIVELANAFEPIQDGRIYIQKINGAVSVRAQGHASGIQGWPRLRDRQGLAGAARERHLCPLRRGRRRAVCLTKKSPRAVVGSRRGEFSECAGLPTFQGPRFFCLGICSTPVCSEMNFDRCRQRHPSE